MNPLVASVSVAFVTFAVGCFTEFLTADRIDRPGALLIMGHWLMVSAVLFWGVLSLDGVGLVLLAALMPQIVRVFRVGLWRATSKRELVKARRQYLDR